MISLQFVSIVVIAAAGWIGTVILIKRSDLSKLVKQLLVLPSWLAWIALALGAPAFTGALSLTTAFGIGGAITAGLLVPTLLSLIGLSR